MKNLSKSLFVSAALAACMLPASAQTPTQAHPNTKAPAIHQRKDNQQQRIGEGVENGSLTAGEPPVWNIKRLSLTTKKRI